MKIDDSVSATISSLEEAFSALEGGGGVPGVFTDGRVLARPPFAYVRALAKFFAERRPSLGWDGLLFAPGEPPSSDDQCPSRKANLSFLSRLLALVSKVSGRRLDVLVSPSKVLCGRDVLLTHEFLRELAASTMSPEGEMAEAVRYVAEEGDASLYRTGVRTRRAFTGLQARVRGWLARREHPVKRTTIGPGQADDDASEADVSAGPSTGRAPKSGRHRSKQSTEEQKLLESYKAVLSRKSEVEGQLKVAEARLKRENDKLIRMLNLGVMHKTRTNPVAPYADIPRPPMSAPSIGMSNHVNNSRSREPLDVDGAFAVTITNFSERQKSMKQKERRIEERETRLKQRFAKSKAREADLKLQEERISDLAGKIRRQQAQLKEQRLQFDRSRLLEPEPPLETSRPCLMCTEKRIQLRDIRTKIKQRTRALSQREAVVIGRAHELRRREMELAKREQNLAEIMERRQSTRADDSHSEHEEPPPEKQRRRSDCEQDEPSETILPDLREASNPHWKKGARKRRRRNRRDATNKMNAERDPTRSSFGEGPIPTIEEETQADEDADKQEDEQSSEGDSQAEQAQEEPAADTGECSEEEQRRSPPAEERRRSPGASNGSLIPTDIDKTRQSLGMTKKRDSQRRSTCESRRSTLDRKKHQHETTAAPRATIVTETPSPKKRHVFTFERQQDAQGGAQLQLNTDRGGRPSTRERDRKPMQHDDWISSFDVQMKCAMNRLRELV